MVLELDFIKEKDILLAIGLKICEMVKENTPI